MKIIAIAAVTAGGKTTLVNELTKILPRAASIHFDDYSFEGEVEDFRQWVLDGADYNVWQLEPLKRDILAARESGMWEYLLLDYPFAYRHDEIAPLIDCAIFLDTPLDIAMARRVMRDMKDASGDEIRADMDFYLRFARAGYEQMLKDILPSSDHVLDGAQELSAVVNSALAVIKAV